MRFCAAGLLICDPASVLCVLGNHLIECFYKTLSSHLAFRCSHGTIPFLYSPRSACITFLFHFTQNKFAIFRCREKNKVRNCISIAYFLLVKITSKD